jgi:hypothetical protein
MIIMAKVAANGAKRRLNGHRDAISVTERRVRDAEGQVKTLRVLDVNSRTFGDDLQYVFSKNVARARRDNRRAIGAPDVVPKR